jgi:hypothetical protein
MPGGALAEVQRVNVVGEELVLEHVLRQQQGRDPGRSAAGRGGAGR